MRRYRAKSLEEGRVLYRLGETSIEVRPDSSVYLKGGPIMVEEILQILSNWTKHKGSIVKSLIEVQLINYELIDGLIIFHTLILDKKCDCSLKATYKLLRKHIKPVRGYIILDDKHKVYLPKELRKLLFPNELELKKNKLLTLGTYNYKPIKEYEIEVLDEILDDVIKDRFCLVLYEDSEVLMCRAEADVLNLSSSEDVLIMGTKFDCIRAISKRKELSI